MTATHISPYAGDWYPSDAAELDRLLDERFADSRVRTGAYQPPDPLGLVVPHAAPAWSGAVAAASYRALERCRPEQIVLLAFPHRGGLGRVATPEVESIRTPLGEVPIDPSFASAFPCTPEWRVCDHSFEIQLPYLQRTAPRARITPLYVGAIDEGQRSQAAATLAEAWRPGVIFVASSDFTHYGRAFDFQPFPHDEQTGERLRDLDFECIEAAGSLDADRFLETLRRNRATVCGAEPIALLLEVLRRLPVGGIYQNTLDYQASGEINGDFAHSVSYAALAYYGRRSYELDPADCHVLRESAEKTLHTLRETGARTPIPAEGGSPALQARRGLFVSLHAAGELLGCIGNIEGAHSLAQDVADLTLSAALDDPRFRPAAEARGPIDIEISVLTPFRLIRDSSHLSIGKHGAFLTLAGRGGLLLPQVAAERGWDASGFLKALARKIGVHPYGWCDPGARLHVFEAQIIR